MIVIRNFINDKQPLLTANSNFMSILAIDYGDKKIGLAKSVDKTAIPLMVLKSTNKADLLKQLKKICKRENIKKIVVGIPLSLNTGQVRQVDLNNKQMKTVLNFIKFLKAKLDLPVDTEDERFSTRMANGLIRGRKKDISEDDIAAMLILQSYLDRNLN